jgi:hypothetical protein
MSRWIPKLRLVSLLSLCFILVYIFLSISWAVPVMHNDGMVTRLLCGLRFAAYAKEPSLSYAKIQLPVLGLHDKLLILEICPHA